MKEIFLLLATAFFFVSTANAAEETPELTDCARAERLPKDAGADSRRIACNIPEDLQESVTLSEFFGGSIRTHDIAAWLTTDSLKKAGAFKENKIPGAALGWLTFEKENLINVRYFARKDERVFVFAQADLDRVNVKVINNEVLANLLPASETELAMLRALDTAKSKELLNCAGPFNSVVLPFTNDNKNEIRVYLFSPWTNKIAPLGGHHLIRVSEDGNEIINLYSQTNACVNFDPNALSHKDLKFLGISHLTSHTPTEMHVFMSLQYKKPIMVDTVNNGITWKVEGKKISVLNRRDGKKPFEASTKRSEDKK